MAKQFEIRVMETTEHVYVVEASTAAEALVHLGEKKPEPESSVTKRRAVGRAVVRK